MMTKQALQAQLIAGIRDTQLRQAAKALFDRTWREAYLNGYEQRRIDEVTNEAMKLLRRPAPSIFGV